MYKSSGDLLSQNTNCSDGTDPYCLSCTKTGETTGCQLCAASFIDEKTKTCKLPSELIDNCGSYNSSDKKCFECRKGYFLSSDGFCVEQTLDGCVDPLDQTKCRECANFMLKEDKTCDTTKPCSQEGCSTCEMKDGKEVCAKCKQDFVLSYKNDNSAEPTCVQSKSDLEGCSLISDGACIGCKFGYFVNSKYGDTVKCSVSPAYESQSILRFFASVMFLILVLRV